MAKNKTFNYSKIKKLKLKRHCPICDGVTGELLHTITFATAKNECFPKGYNIVCCKICGFIFNDTTLTQKDFDMYYKNTSKYYGTDIVGAGSLTEQETARYLKQLERLLPLDKTAKIVDIGCAKGGLLRTLKQMGYIHVYGIEPSAHNLSCLEECGIKGFNASLPELQNIDMKFDVAILSHVAEHIYDLKKALNAISEILANNGILYIEVPNASQYHKMFKAPYYYFDAEHINHFSESTLRTLTKHVLYNSFSCLSSFSCEEDHYTACGIILRKEATPEFDLTNDINNISNIYKYLASSQKVNKILKLAIGKLAAQQTGKIFLWGAGAYLRAQLERGILDSVADKLFCIIDKNKNINGMTIFSSRLQLSLPVKSSSVLSKTSSDDAVIITSVLYQQQIFGELKEMKFAGKIYNLCDLTFSCEQQ